MKLQEICPFARYVRYIYMINESDFPPYVPRDARLFYVKEGIGLIRVENETLKLAKGQVLFINSGVKYRHIPCEVTYLAVNFDFTDNFSYIETPVHNVNVLKTKNYSLLEKITFSDAKCFDSYYVFSNCHPIYSILTQLEKEFIKKLPFYRSETSALLKSVLSFLARKAETPTSINGRFNIEEIISYIQNHYTEQINNEHLAEVFHYHPNYLSAQFKRHIGMPIHRYILETRVIKAGSMIESGYNNLEEIANACGFSDANYFSRYFKKTLGVSPSDFLKEGKIKKR